MCGLFVLTIDVIGTIVSGEVPARTRSLGAILGRGDGAESETTQVVRVYTDRITGRTRASKNVLRIDKKSDGSVGTFVS